MALDSIESAFMILNILKSNSYPVHSLVRIYNS